jgi:hypothetical protein
VAVVTSDRGEGIKAWRIQAICIVGRNFKMRAAVDENNLAGDVGGFLGEIVDNRPATPAENLQCPWASASASRCSVPSVINGRDHQPGATLLSARTPNDATDRTEAASACLESV